MSLWWARRENLDKDQVALIEDLPLGEHHVVLGPPGSGKTNVLLRRAQYVRSQGLPNVLVLSFTRSLTEFIKTGCFDSQGREIFPQSCVSTLESWIRGLYTQHGESLPAAKATLSEWKRSLATEALGFAPKAKLPRYDALFIDEAQDLLSEEVELLSRWGNTLFLVGDIRQKIYNKSSGIDAIGALVRPPNILSLSFHYRLAPEVCRMADRILVPQGGQSLESTCQYNGPRPGRIGIHGPLSKGDTIAAIVHSLRDQMRAYADLIAQGDLLGVIVARKEDREFVFSQLENDSELAGKSQIVRAREASDDDHDPALGKDTPICILTVQGCKGLEFRAVHWPFCEELHYHYDSEHYYTVVTRAKTSLDLYYVNQLPQKLALAYAPPVQKLW
ncbi:AAA family ATPase [Bradyrhizobium arachidis]|uniref:AAA family ATPase n=1 Tax=Bradyrhizobium arachidis TaxID=858423 RepID=UPI0021610E04|nr:AAA family ATPase [Bradyrhizobium arachidis]UVO30404.1 AAA family ATPase [Bradyrhizobium arachidis]